MLFGRSKPDDQQCMSRLPMVLRRHERCRRGAQADAKEGRSPCGQGLDEGACETQRSGTALEIEKKQPEIDQRPDRMQRELERCDNAEVSTAATQRPEKIGVLAERRADDSCVGRYHLGADEV